jgi:tRNA A-37 threonylcarbamoyl transferase component Bud32
MEANLPVQSNEKSQPVVVEYSPGWQRAWLLGFTCLALAMLPFAISAPTMIAFYVASGDFLSATGTLVLCLLYLLDFKAFMVMSDKILIIDESGIRLPPGADLRGILEPSRSRRLAWKKIHHMKMHEVCGGDNFVLKIYAGERLFEIDLRGVNERDAKLFLSALKTFGVQQHLLTALEVRRAEDFYEYGGVRAISSAYGYKGLSHRTPEQALLDHKQLSLKYSTPLQKTGLLLCIAAFPVWGVAGFLGSVLLLPVSLFCFYFHITSVFDNCNMFVAILLLLVFPVLFIVGMALTTCFFDCTLTVGETGISFPSYMAPLLHFHRERHWSEIRRIAFRHRRGCPNEDGVIQFYVGSDLRVSIDLRHLSRAEAEMLLLSFGIWAQHTEQDPEIKLLHEVLSNKNQGGAQITYTRIWEEEMNRRFSSTNFVPLQQGQTLQRGRLNVVKQVAFGGMSAVYLCQVNKTDLVVLKEFVVPDLDLKLQEKARRMFEREATILMKLSHPRLARVLDYFVEAGRTYLLLDYIPGTDLRQIVLQKGTQVERTVVSWARQIAEILAYLHEQEPPVIHRDLTPDNILLNAADQLMLIDFGAANEFVGTATGTLVGKESFIAPEQFRGDTVPASDIYSLGATMFYLLTAQEPQPLSQSFPRQKNPVVSAWINEIVADCTAFEVEKRISTAGALLQRLSRQ